MLEIEWSSLPESTLSGFDAVYNFTAVVVAAGRTNVMGTLQLATVLALHVRAV